MTEQRTPSEDRAEREGGGGSAGNRVKSSRGTSQEGKEKWEITREGGLRRRKKTGEVRRPPAKKGKRPPLSLLPRFDKEKGYGVKKGLRVVTALPMARRGSGGL